ncbi:MAG: ribonuclease P protein subunit [Candidatus Aenigmarchaeota archaeon]|nr:ribonuclease P protein subunit [Candidatus Aenigmarchaeota archaeon]
MQILRDELIGLEAKIISSTNSNMIGIRGKFIDETRNTFVLDTDFGSKTLIKEQSEFFIRCLDADWIPVKGNDLVGRPEDRIRKVSIKTR